MRQPPSKFCSLLLVLLVHATGCFTFDNEETISPPIHDIVVRQVNETFTVPIENHTKDALTVQRVDFSCSCLAVNNLPIAILAGESDSLSLSINLLGRSPGQHRFKMIVQGQRGEDESIEEHRLLVDFVPDRLVVPEQITLPVLEGEFDPMSFCVQDSEFDWSKAEIRVSTPHIAVELQSTENTTGVRWNTVFSVIPVEGDDPFPEQGTAEIELSHGDTDERVSIPVKWHYLKKRS